MSAATDRSRQIAALLPQTQCRQCGYAGCRPYAEAVAAGRADINRCAPGGDELVNELAQVLGVPRKPLDPRFDAIKPAALAVIDETLCIGCTLCIQACPVDAIVGAAKLMHTVIARQCTGCSLCVPVCPADCIEIRETGVTPTREERRLAAERARMRFEARCARLAGKASRQPATESVKTVTVKRAIERAKLRLAQRRGQS